MVYTFATIKCYQRPDPTSVFLSFSGMTRGIEWPDYARAHMTCWNGFLTAVGTWTWNLNFSLYGFVAFCYWNPVLIIILYANLRQSWKIIVELAYLYILSSLFKNFWKNYSTLENCADHEVDFLGQAERRRRLNVTIISQWCIKFITFLLKATITLLKWL